MGLSPKAAPWHEGGAARGRLESGDAMGVEVKPTAMWSTERPVNYEFNHKAHTPETIDKLKALIREFGFINPVIVDDDGIILAGHRRRQAAKELGIERIPVIEVLGLSEAQKMAYRIADNRSAEDSDTDTKVLIAELQKLQALDYDLLNTAFDADELSKLLHVVNEGDGDPDATPETPVNPVSVLGDIWELGSHRFACGSSTEADTVSKVLGGIKPGLMTTDPPYGVKYDPSWRDKATEGFGKRESGTVLNDDKADWREAWALFPGDVAYVWHAGLFASEVDLSLRAAGFEVKSQIIWQKQHYALGGADYHWQHEAAWYVVRKGAKSHHWGGDRTQSTIWSVPNLNPVGKKGGQQKGDEKTGHGTQKPVELFARCIRNNTNPGQAVYDPFLGSGTAIIAAEREGRVAFGCELNPAYADVIVTRWENFTGRTAILAETGETFAEVMARRQPETVTGQRKVKPV